MTISVIIPCFNEEEHLDNLFESIKEHSDLSERIEIILVDNGSNDNSVNIAKKYINNVLIDHNANISKLRNIGAGASTGDILVFLDADCVPQNSWLSKIRKYREVDEVGIFGCIPCVPEPSKWVERAWIESISPVGSGEVDFFNSACMFMKKNVFLDVGGFDENLKTGEDYDICQRVLRAGYKIMYDDEIKVVHLGYPKTLWARFKKELWYGKEMLNIIKIKPLYRPFWASLVFGLSFIFSAVSLLIGSVQIGLWLLFLCLLIPLTSVVSKLSVTKLYVNIPQLFIIFNVYLAARFCSICSSFWFLCCGRHNGT